MSCARVGFGVASSLPDGCADGALLSWKDADQAWVCNPDVRAFEGSGNFEADGDVSLGATDDNTHVIQGITSVIGDPDDVLLTVFGHAYVEWLHVVKELTIWGGQYPSYYGYGMYGDQYHGIPYWGSYDAGDIGPWHGTGTTIDLRGARFDETILIEQGFTIVDHVSGLYYNVQPGVDALGNVTFTASDPMPFEPNAD